MIEKGTTTVLEKGQKIQGIYKKCERKTQRIKRAGIGFLDAAQMKGEKKIAVPISLDTHRLLIGDSVRWTDLSPTPYYTMR